MSKASNQQLKPEAYTRLRGCSPRLCQFLIEKLDITEPDHVLDLGCGPGENTALMAGLAHSRVEGLDLDPSRIAHARESNPSLTFHQASAEALPFEAGAFNVATMMLSVQRFVDRSVVFREVARVLVPGGRIGIATVSPEQLAARPDFRAFPTALRKECDRFPAINELHRELERHGFITEFIEPFREVIRPLDSTFVRWLEEYPFSVLRQIPDEEFRNGLRAIRETIKTSGAVQLLVDEYTVISAIKP